MTLYDLTEIETSTGNMPICAVLFHWVLGAQLIAHVAVRLLLRPLEFWRNQSPVYDKVPYDLFLLSCVWFDDYCLLSFSLSDALTRYLWWYIQDHGVIGIQEEVPRVTRSRGLFLINCIELLASLYTLYMNENVLTGYILHYLHHRKIALNPL